MADRSRCHILFSRDWPTLDDEHGCLKAENHYDHHVFRNKDGRLIAWKDYEDCGCGCWEDDHDQPCNVYWEVKSINE